MATQEPPMPIRDGYGAALDRVTQAGLFDDEPDPDSRWAAQRTLEDAMNVLGGDEPDRYVSLYAEVAAVGAFARARYGEASLDYGELLSLHENLSRFLNSWVHRHDWR